MLEPWGDQWRQTGKICETIWNASASKDSELRQADSFMPLPNLSELGLAEEDDADADLDDDDGPPDQTEDELDRVFRAGGNKVIHG